MGKGKVEINAELCKGCKYCVMTCPKGVIVPGERFNASGFYPAIAVFADKCTGCALCAEMCPEIAITVWREIPSNGEGRGNGSGKGDNKIKPKDTKRRNRPVRAGTRRG